MKSTRDNTKQSIIGRGVGYVYPTRTTLFKENKLEPLCRQLVFERHTIGLLMVDIDLGFSC